ncbi:DMT family transporter [Albidovulum sp.]|uniref:DMT family transporter n=1 Tax=Albidovulum sp. TaxID=1872424 RepID=UPI001DCE4B99|nr:DMT family transporter [Paracoccaceae bacterium]MCC0046812.1 DMT family transporter [Defluviimonas sp.]HPE25462.1 DMT family transporter [Albidovulum sp.]MCB2120156.1 DMT family transporter [Paracoccaceae bacterium]MCB2122747.1 DMT family transporter [Paracoccaceae bacterium]
MERRNGIDAFGAGALVAFALFLAFNQIIIKMVNAGLQPVFFAGLRSLVAAVALWGWMRWRGRPTRLSRDMAVPGIAVGLVFGLEFLFMFMALDLTTVTRTAVLLYSMPVWMALAAHFLLPEERLRPVRVLGLGLAFFGVILALTDRTAGGEASLAGDLCAVVAAICWAAIALLARVSRLSRLAPDMQLWWQVLVSIPLLLGASVFFGPFIRDLQPIHLAGLAYQGVVVVAAGFALWLWLLSIYPVSGVASFAFLTPVFGVALGWLLLGEPVGPRLFAALVLVAAGIVLINRPRKA